MVYDCEVCLDGDGRVIRVFSSNYHQVHNSQSFGCLYCFEEIKTRNAESHFCSAQLRQNSQQLLPSRLVLLRQYLVPQHIMCLRTVGTESHKILLCFCEIADPFVDKSSLQIVLSGCRFDLDELPPTNCAIDQLPQFQIAPRLQKQKARQQCLRQVLQTVLRESQANLVLLKRELSLGSHPMSLRVELFEVEDNGVVLPHLVILFQVVVDHHETVVNVGVRCVYCPQLFALFHQSCEIGCGQLGEGSSSQQLLDAGLVGQSVDLGLFPSDWNICRQWDQNLLSHDGQGLYFAEDLLTSDDFVLFVATFKLSP